MPPWRRAGAATFLFCSRRGTDRASRGICRTLTFLLSTYPQVLSVATALSIQAHPDKVLAAKLFAERPDVYKVRSQAAYFPCSDVSSQR